jgi:putative pyruvate formate lyase activating enzyme
MKEIFNSCTICPRNCGVNRNKGKLGFCMATNKLVVARASLHYWEEPCLSDVKGSGTIFFSYCNLKCVFCQNYDISTLHKGKEVTIERLADICLELQEKGANNINLVTPTHFVPLIVDALKLAKSKGLKIPIVYNTSGYEKAETIKSLEGLIDIYLPDLKYYSDTYAIKYSQCPNYFHYAKNAIKEMYRQVGKPKFNNDGLMVKGVIVRHLLLPKMEEDSKKIIKYLYDTYKDNIYISIMNQYTPIRKTCYQELNQKIDNDIYDEVINYAYDLGVRKAFIQEEETQSESFIPNFNNEGV